MTAFLAILKRDITLGLRQGGGAGAAIAFMLSVLVLIPLALGPDQNLLRRLAPGIMWLSLLLAVLLTSERIFQQDYEDGTLDALVGIALPLELVTLAKALAHWISVGSAFDDCDGPWVFVAVIAGGDWWCDYSGSSPWWIVGRTFDLAALCARPYLWPVCHTGPDRTKRELQFIAGSACHHHDQPCHSTLGLCCGTPGLFSLKPTR
jgi:CcmB protein